MNISEQMIREMILEILSDNQQNFQKNIDKSGVISVKTSTVKCEPFEQDGVYVKDIVSLTEAPRIGAGVMEIDHTTFAWKLTYDEFDYIIDGCLEIEIDGRTIRGEIGDIIYIPKGSDIKFRSDGKARYAYFVYPANWQTV